MKHEEKKVVDCDMPFLFYYMFKIIPTVVLT